MGWGIMMNLKSGRPHVVAIALPVTLNTSVMIEADGTPCCSNTIESSTLPDEQDPQSPTPATITSQFALNSSTISACGAAPALFFLRITCAFAPCFDSSSDA